MLEENALEKTNAALETGKAAEIFSSMVRALGGPHDFVENHETYLVKAPIIKPVFAEAQGFIGAVNGRNIGNAIIGLKGGRRKPGEKLDLSTGFSEILPIGTKVDTKTPIAMVHAQTEKAALEAAQLFKNTCQVQSHKPDDTPLLYEKLTAQNLS